MHTTKPWFMSRSIWGSLIALVAALAASFGIDIEPGSTEIWTDAALQLVTVIASLFAIFGRVSATSAIR